MAKEKKDDAKASEAFDKATAASEKATKNKEAKRALLDEFLAKNELKKTVDHTGKIADKKLQKQYNDLRADWTKAKEAAESAKDAVKASKPAKERAVKYVYPSDVTDSVGKKKFRTKCRGAAKRAGVTVDVYLSDPAKYDKAAKPAKEKASKTEEAPAKKKGAKTEEAAAPAKKKVKKADKND